MTHKRKANEVENKQNESNTESIDNEDDFLEKYVLQQVPPPRNRIKGVLYLVGDEIKTWSGKIWNCKHNIRRQFCKECDGSGFCEHNRRHTRCEKCGGGGICEHSRQRDRCQKCCGGSICEHKRRRNTCRECRGPGICKHDRRRSTCQECKGSEICEHDLRRAPCRECAGGSVCDHNRRRTQCKECNGRSICPHRVQKHQCSKCSPQNFCQCCKYTHIQRSKYKPLCFPCYCFLNPNEPIARNHRKKEHHIMEILLQKFPSMIRDRRVDNGCSKRRPDGRIECFTHSILPEINENQHKDRDPSCENRKLMEEFLDLGNRPVVEIRFNPDGYVDANDIKHQPCFEFDTKGKMTVPKNELERRMSVFVSEIQKAHTVPDKEVSVVELFYDGSVI